jgi:hypothetical protein
MNGKLVAITLSGDVKVVTDYKVVNHGSVMNPEMYIDSVEVDGEWVDADKFKEVTIHYDINRH